MHILSKIMLVNVFCLSTLPAIADDSTDQLSQQQALTSSQNLVEYLVNLGGYLGYNVTQPPTANNNTISQTLLNMTTTQVMQTYLYTTFLGAIPVNTFSAALAQFIPSQLANADSMNALANSVFNVQTFNNPAGQQQGKVTVNSLIDQTTYQQDPVSQGILNILATPDSSYCMQYGGRDYNGVWIDNCTIKYSDLVSANVIGNTNPPLPSTYYTYAYNQQFLSQLNGNTLIAPLLYSTQSTSANSTSSPTPTQQNTGLPAQNQAQQAANFVRYVSGSVTPMKLPNLKDYDVLYGQAYPGTGTSTTVLQQKQAQATLNNYLTSLRTYAAQTSVGLSNLYFMMSKRLPQNPSGGSASTQSSQAMSEFNLATWRLFNPDMTGNKQWINQVNTASPATVQKEIATLLAEMSYQMYLDRQIQERILLTNTIMLLQNTRAAQPNASFQAPSD
jgi:intracellular multiplication protein IcmX